jgi:undecaprenyl diphosphate synthase
VVPLGLGLFGFFRICKKDRFYWCAFMTTDLLSSPDIADAPSAGPRHIAIILDGNNRWAKKRGLHGVEGHRQGAITLKNIVKTCAMAAEIEALTVFAFSSENWRRPEEEVQALMALFWEALQKEVPELAENGVCLKFIGDFSPFNERIRAEMQKAEQLTSSNRRLTLVVAINYGGRWDIVHAAKQIAQLVEVGEYTSMQIDEKLFDRFISLSSLPGVDLCIRTGGEKRVSNFLLWQIAYSELYFTDVLWPDFDHAVLHQALLWFSQRQRRFGRTQDQVLAMNPVTN